MESKLNDYIIIKKIASGNYSTVYKAQHIPTKTMVALKQISKKKIKTKNEFKFLQREVYLLKSLDHPFIATFFEVVDDLENFYISMELIENQTLLDYVENSQGISEPEARTLFLQIISIIYYLHKIMRVMHRDIKDDNFLIDVNNNIKIIDFGLSRVFDKKDPFLSTPEIIKEKPYTSAADIWSLGVVLYTMVACCLPFNGDNVNMQLHEILYAEPLIPESWSCNLRDLMRRLLNKDPGARITLEEIMNHPWITEFNDKNCINEDLNFLLSIKVVDLENLDQDVLLEMMNLGFDVDDIQHELEEKTINRKTATYKILRSTKLKKKLFQLPISIF
ncbi:hypothetical protein M9Y10_032542 [Tritrichomonas musculus]|uniref:CAMK family protein kinase n=1 Tax=Tritrichomonas musculus TaxID=1915356 RepID=A0ABR2GZJ3_9EUKA